MNSEELSKLTRSILLCCEIDNPMMLFFHFLLSCRWNFPGGTLPVPGGFQGGVPGGVPGGAPGGPLLVQTEAHRKRIVALSSSSPGTF